MKSQKQHPVRRAAQVVGSLASLADRLDVSRGAVWQWLDPERKVPFEHCIEIERITRELGDPVLCEELRPDIDWAYLRNSAAPAGEKVT